MSQRRHWTRRQRRLRNQLNELGWDVSTLGDLRRAKADFRYGWARGPRLRKGQTKRLDREVETAVARKRQARPNASKHFSFHEMTCNGPASDRGCRRIHVDRTLLRAMDDLRDEMGRPLKVLSPYRCPVHNDRVDGASSSMHKYGKAFDPLTYVGSAAWVKSLRLFSGIGYDSGTGRFRHGDVRPGSKASPTMWRY